MGANAQTSVPSFTAGDILTAANMNISARTGVPVFATTADRDAAFGGTGEKTLAEGQTCYIEAAPKRFQIYDGTAWKDFHVNYTDVSSSITFGGFTKGNATIVSKYTRLGDFVHFFGSVILGSTSSMTGALDVSLPVTSEYGILYHPSAAYTRDASSGIIYWGYAINIGTSSLRLVNTATSGTYATNADMGATVPFTWTTSDEFWWNHFYKAA